jgi:hypothetical protein
LCLCALVWAGCGEDGGSAKDASARLSDAEPRPTGAALTLTRENAAVPLRPPLMRGAEYRGDLTLMQDNTSLGEVHEALGSAVVTVQIIDEREASSAADAQQNPGRFQATKRLGDLYAETDAVLGANGLDDWPDYTLVFDLFRTSGAWLLRWDGTNISQFDSTGVYGLWRDDMREDILAILRGALNEALADGKPVTRVVLGAGMERLLAGPDGPVNPADFANFVDFFVQTRRALKEEFPDIAFSAGLNWDNLITYVAARYTVSGEVADVRFGEVRAVWRDVAAPLYEEADFIALSSEPQPSLYGGSPNGIPESQYALLAEVQGERSIVWHSIHWPSDSGATKGLQEIYLERFLALNAGNKVDLIAWNRLVDLPEGTAECNGVVNLGGPVSSCFGGLFRDSLAPSEVSDLYLAR